MRTLTKRERGLFYCAILLFSIYLGVGRMVAPARTARQEAQNQLSMIENENRSLEKKFGRAEAVEREYLEKREAVKKSVSGYRQIASGIKAEQHMLSYLDRAGLEPVKTAIREYGPELEEGYQMCRIEVKAEGSWEASMRMLELVSTDPLLDMETWILLPGEEPGRDVFRITAEFAIRLPVTWEDADKLVSGG